MSVLSTFSWARLICEEVACPSIKVASTAVMSFEMLDEINSHAATVNRVYLSTGMASPAEIRRALQHLDDIEEVAILHCVIQYPAPPQLTNLRTITTLAQAFPTYPIGYSDHTMAIWPAWQQQLWGPLCWRSILPSANTCRTPITLGRCCLRNLRNCAGTLINLPRCWATG